MADESTSTATQAATPTEAAPQADVPAGGVAAPEAPASVAAARAGLGKGLVTAVDEAQAAESGEPGAVTVDAQGRKHGPDGKFVPKDDTQDSAASTVAETQSEPAPPPTAEATSPDEGEQDADAEATPSVPEGFVKIELPAGHPLRDRGHEFILAPEGQESDYRNLVNQPTRRAEVERAQQRASEVEDYAVRLEAALRAEREFGETLFANPKILATHLAIREEQGEEAAKLWLEGLKAQQGRSAEKYLSEAQQRVRQQQLQRTAYDFMQNALPRAMSRYPEWGEREVRQALASYGAYVEATRGESLDEQAFLQHADLIYLQNPRVREKYAALRAEEQRKAAEKQAAEQKAREKAALEAAAQTRATNPLGAVPREMNAGRTEPLDSGGPTTIRDAKKALRGPLLGAPVA